MINFKRNMFQKAFLTITLLFTTPSFGYLLIEPAVGYSTSTQLKYTVNNVSFVFNQSMIPVSLDIGYQSPDGYYLVATGEYGFNGKLAGTTNAAGVGTTYSDSFYNVAAGLKAGYRTRYLRIFVGYQPMDNMSISPDVNNTNSPWAFSGSSVEGGLGIFLSNDICLVGKYDAVTYSTFTGAGSANKTNLSTNATYTSVSDSRITAELSFPFLF